MNKRKKNKKNTINNQKYNRINNPIYNLKRTNRSAINSLKC
jgi:hypothetical protein